MPKAVFGLTVPFSTILVGNLFSVMLDHGWEVHLVVGERVPRTFPVDSRVHVHVVSMSRRISPIADLRALWGWYSILRRISPDICIGATPKAGMLSMVAAKFARVPNRVYQVWGAKWDGLQGVTSWILRKSDGVAVWCSTETVACSKSMADLMVEAGITAKRPTVIGFGGTKGVDLSIFQPSANPSQRPPSPVIIGFVGRIAKGKGIEYLLPLLRELRQKYPDMTLEIVGDEDAADPLPKDYLEKLKLEPGVILHGYQTHVAEYFRRIDVLVFPSHREGLPNVVIEAAAMGVPAVAWNVTGVSDAIDDAVTGYLVPHGNLAEMNKKISQLVDDPNLRIQFGKAAILFVGERFASQKVIGSQVDFFESLTSGE